MKPEWFNWDVWLFSGGSRRYSEYTAGGWNWNCSVEKAQGGFMAVVKEDRKSIEADDWLWPLLREQP